MQMALAATRACGLPAARGRALAQRSPACAALPPAARALRCVRVGARPPVRAVRAACAAAAAADAEPPSQDAPVPAPTAPSPDASVVGRLKGFFGGGAKLDKAKLAALGTSALLAYGSSAAFLLQLRVRRLTPLAPQDL
jgi:hypothetical protein